MRSLNGVEWLLEGRHRGSVTWRSQFVDTWTALRLDHIAIHKIRIYDSHQLNLRVSALESNDGNGLTKVRVVALAFFELVIAV